MRQAALFSLVLFTWLASPAAAAPAQGRGQAARPFTTPLSVEQMTGKQAVVETSAGRFVIDLRPDLAPNHVGYFIKLARDGAYDGTVFHRVIRHGIIQGGDPLSKDPAKRAQYGTGGLGVLQAEVSDEHHTRGAVSAVLQPNRPDSAGSQFFVCVTDQAALDGKYTIFGRVTEGLDVVTRISEVAADAEGAPTDRVVITAVTIRDTPPPEPVPFAGETPAELARHQVVLDTSVGPITLEFLADKAPETARAFLQLAAAGVFDGTRFHRVVPGFVIQTGSLDTRGPLTEKQQARVHPLAPEFNDTPHVTGVVSMARGDDPGSATTSFFIVSGDGRSLDGKYTAFARVVDGLPVVEQIERAPVNGETPVTPITLTAVRIVR